jgi:cobalt-precorrin 5A hydrolase
MVVGEAVIVAGLGSRKGVTAAQVLAATDAALAAHGLTREQLSGFATASRKRDEPALHAASATLGLELTVVDDAALLLVAGSTLTRSYASFDKAGGPSVSEASALAAAGAGARLLGPRVVVGPVTCAIAVSERAP